MDEQQKEAWHNIWNHYCAANSLDKVKEYLKKTPEIDLTYKDGGLSGAASGGNIEVLHYLLTSPKLKYNPNIHAQDDAALISAAQYGQIKAFDYLLYSPQLQEHANLHAQNDGVFEVVMKLYQNPYMKVLKSKPIIESMVIKYYNFLEHLILNINFPKTNNVIAYLADNPCPQIEKMFQVQEDMKIFSKELPVSKQKTTRKKI